MVGAGRQRRRQTPAATDSSRPTAILQSVELSCRSPPIMITLLAGSLLVKPLRLLKLRNEVLHFDQPIAYQLETLIRASCEQYVAYSLPQNLVKERLNLS